MSLGFGKQRHFLRLVPSYYLYSALWTEAATIRLRLAPDQGTWMVRSSLSFLSIQLRGEHDNICMVWLPNFLRRCNNFGRGRHDTLKFWRITGVTPLENILFWWFYHTYPTTRHGDESKISYYVLVPPSNLGWRKRWSGRISKRNISLKINLTRKLNLNLNFRIHTGTHVF